MKRLVSDWFCVATAGATVDGRELKDQWLLDMGETYDPKHYEARLWPDHWRWYDPFGEVYAAESREVEGKLKLFTQITPSAGYQNLVQRGFNVYPSVEVVENFAGSSQAYLYGLGVTDSPASVGTDRINFHAASAGVDPSKHIKGKLFAHSETIPQNLVFNEVSTPSIFDLGSWFKKQEKEQEPEGEDVDYEKLGAVIGAEIEKTFTPLNEKLDGVINQFSGTGEENKGDDNPPKKEPVAVEKTDEEKFASAFGDALKNAMKPLLEKFDSLESNIVENNIAAPNEHEGGEGETFKYY